MQKENKSEKKIMGMKPKTLIITVVCVTLIGYLGWKIYQKAFAGRGGWGQRETAVAVEIAPVTQSQIKDMGTFSGSLIPKTQFTIVPKISGKLKQLLVDIGDEVQQDQLVAVLEDEEYQQQVIQAEADLQVTRANLEEAKSSLEIAKRDLERAETLHEKGIQSDSQMDAAKAQHDAQEARYKVALAQLENREAALETARVRLSYTRIKATWEKGAGTRYVGERFVHEGAMLSPSTPILSIIELQPVTAVIHVTDKDYFRLAPEQKVTISSNAFQDKAFAGRVVRIAPLLQETSRQARVEVEIQNPEFLLKPGMFINAQIEFGIRDQTTVIPYAALVNRDAKQGVFLVEIETMKAKFVPVRVGIVESEKAEILEPNPLTGFVVVLGHHLLEDGTGVILPESVTQPVQAAPDTALASGNKTPF
jgi:RND family efflux transporter MFP subunit